MTTGISIAGASRRQILISLLLLTLVTLAVRVPLLNLPLERDEGEYAYIAWRMGHHELPYRDWFDQKPPGIFWVYRAALALPLDPVCAVHLMGLLFALDAAVALFFLAGRFLPWFWALAAGTLFSLLLADPLMLGPAANTETFMLLPLLLSQLVFFSATDSGRRRAFFWTGVLVGIATVFKQVAGVNWFLLLALFPVFYARERRARRTLDFAAWSAAGAGAVWAVIGGYFLLRHGFPDFLYNVFTHNFEYVAAMPAAARWENCRQTLGRLAEDQTWVWLFALAGLAALAWTRQFRALLFLAGWLGSSLLAVSVSGYFFPHYFQQALPALCLAAGAGGALIGRLEVFRKMPPWLLRTMTVALLAGPVAAALYPYLGRYSATETLDRMYPNNRFAAMPDLARRVAAVTRPEDKVYVFGAEPEVLFYARRVSASRYIFLLPLYGPYAGAKEKQAAAAAEIERNHPAAIFYRSFGLMRVPGSEQFLTHWTDAYAASQFQPDTLLLEDSSGQISQVTGLAGQTNADLAGSTVIAQIYVRQEHGERDK